MKPFSSVGAFALGCASLASQATTTAVNPLGGGAGGERCLYSASGFCGGGSYEGAYSLIRAFEMDLGYAPGSFVRVDDDFDQLWQNSRHYGEVQARARYASDNSRLGFDAGSGYVNLTSVLTDADRRLVRVEDRFAFAADPRSGDFVSAADAWLPIPLAAGELFAFVLHDVTTGRYFSSDASRFDHMVSFRVPDSVPHYFIAWEDRDPGDRDYNDLVVEVRYSSPAPEPASYALLAAGLGLLGFVARRRRLNTREGALFH